MKKLFDLAAKRHEDIVKEAHWTTSLMSGLGKGTMNVGKALWKNKGMAATTALTLGSIASDTAAGASRAAKSAPGTFLVSPLATM